MRLSLQYGSGERHCHSLSMDTFLPQSRVTFDWQDLSGMSFINELVTCSLGTHFCNMRFQNHGIVKIGLTPLFWNSGGFGEKLHKFYKNCPLWLWLTVPFFTISIVSCQLQVGSFLCQRWLSFTNLCSQSRSLAMANPNIYLFFNCL